jgi:RHS repeat-associated protein
VDPCRCRVYDWVGGDQALKRTTTMVYDRAGQMVSAEAPNSEVTTFTWTATGLLERETLAGGSFSEFGYDAAGRVRRQTNPSPTGTGTVDVVTGYSLRGEVVSVTNAHVSGSASPPTSTFTYWPDGLLASSTNPLGGAHATVGYFYDARGNRTERSSWTQASSVAAPHVVVDTWDYDLADRVVRHRPAGDPIGTTTAYNDVHGWPELVTEPSGNLSIHAWWNNGAPRATLDVRLAVGSTPGQSVARSDWYDTAANVTHTLERIDGGWASCESGTPIAKTWTPTGELASITHPDNVNTPVGVDETLAYTWDLNGLARTTTFADGVVHTTSHDRLGRITQTRTNSPTDTAIAAYTYNANGQVTSEVVSGGQTTRTWAYPANGTAQPASYAQTSPGANRATALSWGPTGDLATETTAGATRSYSYDAARQLLARTDTAGPDYAYTYGPRGLRLTENVDGWVRTYTYNDRAQLTTTSYGLFRVDNTYNPDGELIASTSAVLGQSTYTYDPRGYTQTNTADFNAGIGDDFTETRSYDAHGQLSRSQRSLNGAPSADTTYLANPRDPAAQPLLTRTTPTNQARTHTGLDLVGHQHNTNPPINLAFDHQHSVIANTASPNHPSTYDPYGTPTPARTAQIGYRTQTHYNNLLHLHRRDYSPNTGVFTTPDPLDGQPATTTETNPYHYTNNNPTNNTDPHGLSPTDYSLERVANSGRRTRVEPWHRPCAPEGQYRPILIPDEARMTPNRNWDTQPWYSRFDDVEVWRSVFVAAQLARVAIPDAADNMTHFLLGTGNDKTINVDRMLQDVRRLNRDVEISARAAATDTMGTSTTSCEVHFESDDFLGFAIARSESRNWFLAQGKVRFKVQGFVRMLASGEMVIRYQAAFLDPYDWDPNDPRGMFEEFAAPVLYNLHTAGLARHYVMYGISRELYLSW